MIEQTIRPQPKDHPYLDNLQKTLERQKKLLEHLELRRVILLDILKEKPDNLYANDTPRYDTLRYNDYEITLIETEGRIESQKRSVKEKEQYFIKFIQQFAIDLKDCEKFFDTVVEKAKKMATSNKRIKDIVDSINWSNVDTNDEVKVALFKRLVSEIK